MPELHGSFCKPWGARKHPSIDRFWKPLRLAAREEKQLPAITVRSLTVANIDLRW
jgi:hypothetical protein